MGEAVGLSHLYPAVPIMNVFSMMLLLLLIPGFWKTRIVALVSLVGWSFIGNLVSFLGMIYWRGHTDDALVWASILTALGRTWFCGFFTSISCFAHFTWQRLQPLSACHLYDTRRRDNLIHLFLTLILPVLWAPLFLLSCDYRYGLLEDFGPTMSFRKDWPGFVVNRLPSLLSYNAVVIFNVLTLVRYWHVKKQDTESDLLKHHPSVRTRKLLIMAGMNTPLATYGIYSQIISWGSFGWTPPKSLTENISSLQSVLTVTRRDLDSSSFELTASVRARTAISIPLVGYYVFAWFGCGAEARKTYGDGLLKFGGLVGVAGTLFFSWSAIALRKAKSHQGSIDPLPLVQLYAPHITPYISTVPQEHRPLPPTNPARIRPFNRVGNAVNEKRGPPPKELASRLSIHKPSFMLLNPANAATDLVSNSPARRLPSHRPPLLPLYRTNTTPNGMPLVPTPSVRRLSHHKPTFSLLDSSNAIPNTTFDPSGGMRQHPDDANNARRQEKFA